jgi:hypothetical protein
VTGKGQPQQHHERSALPYAYQTVMPSLSIQSQAAKFNCHKTRQCTVPRAVGQATTGIMVAGTAGSNLLPAGNGPDGLTQGVAGPLLGDLAKLMVTGLPEDHASMLAAGHSERAGAGQGLEAVSCALMLAIDSDADLHLSLIDEVADEVILLKNTHEPAVQLYLFSPVLLWTE